MRLALAAWLVAAAACAPERRVPAPLDPCGSGELGRMAECGTVMVPERPGGELIALRVVRLPALARRSASEPLFLLAGGPGQAASEAFPAMLPFLHNVVRERDVVMVDQRGTGSSAPIDCAMPADLGDKLDEDALAHAALSCARDRDISAYLTSHAADDLDAVREALGYARIDVLGVSYGTRLGLEYARRHPAGVRALVLDGVAPAWMAIPQSFAADAQRALDAVLARCQEEACGKAFPELRAALDALLASLADEPRRVTLSHPRTGEPLDVTITRDGFALALRALLYAPEVVALLPFTLSRAAHGDFAPFVAVSALFAESTEEHMSLGLLFTVICNEDVPRITDAAGSGFVAGAAVASFAKACAGWPRVRVSQDYYARAAIDAPALLLSGALDPATPPRWADDVLRDLPKGRHLVVPGMAHGVAIRGCVPEIIDGFLDAPEAELDASCLRDEAPAFFIDAAGPRP